MQLEDQQLECEEAERRRHWDHFLVTRAPKQAGDAAAGRAAQRRAALQELSTWLQEARQADEPGGMLVERCTQVLFPVMRVAACCTIATHERHQDCRREWPHLLLGAQLCRGMRF
jgi:hypothetical protein